MACQFGSPFRIVSVNHGEYFVMVTLAQSGIYFQFTRHSPSSLHSIIVLVVRHWHTFVNQVTHFVDQNSQTFNWQRFFLFCYFDLLHYVLNNLNFFSARVYHLFLFTLSFWSFFLICHNFISLVALFIKLVQIESFCSPHFVLFNNIVNYLCVLKSLWNGFTHFFRVTSLFSSEQIYIKSH